MAAVELGEEPLFGGGAVVANEKCLGGAVVALPVEGEVEPVGVLLDVGLVAAKDGGEAFDDAVEGVDGLSEDREVVGLEVV